MFGVIPSGAWKNTPVSSPPLAALSDEARARGVEMSALAPAWVLHHPRMTAAIIGPRKPAHVEPALAALEMVLSPGDTARIGGFLVGEDGPG